MIRARLTHPLLIACLRALLIIAFTLLGATARAQPLEGALLNDVIALGSGRSVPLPEGQWKVIGVRQQRGERRTPPSQNRWTAYFLRNQDPAALMPLVIVYSGQASGSFWGNTVCRMPNSALLVNQYGTLPTGLENRCSGIRGVNQTTFSEHWRTLYEFDVDLNEVAGGRQDSLAVALLKVFKLREGLEFEAFIRLPAGASSRRLREGIQSDENSPAATALHAWLAAYVERVDQSYLGKQPQQYPALAFNGAMPQFDASAPMVAPADEQSREALRREIAERERERLAREQERLAAEAKAREQERLATEAKTREQERLASEARAREQARLAAEARVREQERLAAEARAREQEQLAARAREQEQARLAAEARLREQERLAAQARAREEAARIASQRDAELARLREQLAQLEAQKSAQAAAPVAAGGVRRALVIGNDSYAQVSRLQNAREDARAMAASLQTLGYQVTLRLDLREREMKQVMRVFKAQVEGGDEVVIFFAGHGVQFGGTNFLLPVDIAGESEDQVRDEAIPLQRLLDDMAERKARFTLALLDACRDNPFKTAGRSLGGRGLAPTNAATGQMVIFSAGAGQQALDRLGPGDKDPNGLFTRVFLREMRKPGISVDRVVRNVRTEVVGLARSVGHDQVPAIYDQVVGEFFFIR
ncbi:MAG: caspase family protein [Burkholderiales bacterium]